MLAPLVLENLEAATVAPSITAQPASQSIQAGSIATFSVTAAGVNITYQWFKNNVAILGATSATLSYGPTAYPSDNGDQFYVTVSNTAGFVTSGIAVLTVLLVTAAAPAPVQTTGSDIVLGALLNINAYSPGQPLSPQIGSQCLTVLNDLIDSLSTDQNFIYTQTENIFGWTPGKYKYTIGNPVGGNFAGTLLANSALISNVTAPATLALGASLSDLQGAIPSGTTVLAIGANTVTMSQPALFTVTGFDIVTYTTPGDIDIARPLRIRSGYTRVTGGVANGLDYWFDCQNTMDRYNEIGFKGVAGPWPYMLAYQPTYPLGTVWIYPNPQSSNEVHLFTDLIISEFTLTGGVDLPQGYSRALKKLLALELCPMFGKTPNPMLIKQAKDARDLIESQNSSPVETLRYDSDLIYSRHTDASWIMSGGFV